MLVKSLQNQNAESPILVTLLGIVMLVNFSHPENALFPILVTPYGITTVSSSPTYSVSTPSLILKSPSLPSASS